MKSKSLRVVLFVEVCPELAGSRRRIGEYQFEKYWNILITKLI
jgi:hypothetical protein